jgi:hypothetical protein
MGWFKKKTDPISERAKALNAEIAALETKIKKLSAQAPGGAPAPRLRSTALPTAPAVPVPVAKTEPVFEDVGVNPAKAAPQAETTPAHYNEHGVRKYDLPAAWRRLKDHFFGPPVNNPKLVNFLAAGSIQGLRPLRYEKRVARNRFLLFFAVLMLVLLGIILMLARNR